MKKKMAVSFVGLVVIIGIIGGGFWYNSTHPNMSGGTEMHEGGREHHEGGIENREGERDKGKEHSNTNNTNPSQNPPSTAQKAG